MKEKTLYNLFSKEDVEKAKKYISHTYPILWKMEGEKQKLKLIKKILEAKNRKGYAPWEIEEEMGRRLGLWN